ncbi:MAG TPA: peptidylprolyl isomerase, partial [Thermoanaerobaculia bacterium]|nr:peptidylprolyl isomerase [Thermoanaerobaculia bacterium]
RPGEATAFLVTIVLLVTIALLGVQYWKTIDEDFKAAGPAAGAGSGPGPSAGDEAVVTVNGLPIRQSEFLAALATVPEQMQAPLASEAGRKALAEELVRMKLLEDHARRRGLDKEPAVAGQISIVTGNILANAALRDLATTREPLTPRELYDQNLRQFESVRLSQIVIPYEGSVAAAESDSTQTEAEAVRKAGEIVQKLRGGADFAALARQESADRDSASRGGDIGMVGHGTFPDEVDEILFSLPVGSVSDPMKTMYGIHVFKVTDKQTRSFAEVEQALVRSGRQLQVENLVEDLRKDATVEFNPKFFPSEATKAPAADEPDR